MEGLPLEAIRAAIPPEGFFKDKTWLLSPEPLVLDGWVVDAMQELGSVLSEFAVTINRLYFASRAGAAPAWISRLLDQGKPEVISSVADTATFREQLPRVIRPDVLVTDEGLKVSEIDSLPGGIGLTGWLNQLYGRHGWPVIGGDEGMIRGFERAIDGGKIYISREAQDYRPEMAWIVEQMNHATDRDSDRLVDTWIFDPAAHRASTAYRYFELWDFENVENFDTFKALAASGETTFTPPLKAFLEEKLWLALLWNPGLRAEWTRRLGADAFARFKQFVPEGWILDPAPIPFFSEYPGLGIQNWEELKGFSQKSRRLVIKVSGYSNLAWGARGVHVGHDMPHVEWQDVITQALTQFPTNPHTMQRFYEARVMRHPYYDRQTGEVRVMDGRARLCPYYFVHDGTVTLSGVLATICPKDKKVLHGMADAILVPCIKGR